MEYPKNGGIVIVDDQIAEVEDLILAFSQQNVPTYYFSGKESKLHRNLDNIKLIFLDADYEHSGQPTGQNKVDYMVQIISSLINDKANDYIVIVWSTAGSSFREPLEERLNSIYKLADKLPPEKKLYKLPKRILSITKNDVKVGDNFDISLINEEINKVLDNNDILNLSISWENNVLQSAKNVLKNFETITSSEEEQKKIYSLFADSISKKENLSSENIINSALTPVSNLLSDQLSILNLNNSFPEIQEELLSLINTKLDLDSIAKINSFYHIDNDPYCNNLPGSIYDYNAFHIDSCSSKECTTKWTEGLKEKIKFTPKNYKEKFKEDFTNNYENELNEFIKFDKQKSFYTNIENIFNTEFNLNIFKTIYLYIGEYNYEDQNDSLKKYVRAFNKTIQERIINKQCNLIFGKNLDSEITDTKLNDPTFSNKQYDQKLKILSEYYISTSITELKKEFEEKTIPIFLEFSPDCDYVQSKRKKLRLVFGLLYPFYEYTNNEEIFKGDYFIYSPIFEYLGKPYRIVLDLHTITGINEDILENKNITNSMFRFRKEFIVDVQQKIATHISRPGYFNMNDYLN